jgi:methylenetetrahydrofolate dehydrogenase (NADP+)/methenyltetrahydrofolate cyclohydrolase
MKIDCERIANDMLKEAKDGIALLKKQGITPTLCIIKVGNDPASEVYVKNKVKTCTGLGIRCIVNHLPEDITQEDLERSIAAMHEFRTFNGIEFMTDGMILQLPLPAHLDAEQAIKLIYPHEDVDGLTEGAVVMPCTPTGIMRILDAEGIELAGKHAVIVGRSKLVGKPLAKMLLDRDCTVTVCHSKTADLALHTREADILISAVGKPGLIEAYMVKPDAVVIDVGISRVDGKLVGDVDPWVMDYHQDARITPVPGGVGKTTVAALACNLVKLALKRHGLDKAGDDF